MSATLGGLLKDYRLQYNISQLEVALALGWKETSRLSRIEQGKIFKPTRELLERIMDAMRLKEEEKNQLLYIGNYLPTREEIVKIQKIMSPIIEKIPYPVAVFDFSWRTMINNQVLYKLFKVNISQQKYIHTLNPNIIEIVFDLRFMLNVDLKKEYKKSRRQFLHNMLVQFLFEQRSRRKEKWFLDLIKKMMPNPIFLVAWQEAIKLNFTPQMFLPTKSVFHPESGQELNLYLSTHPLNIDPRFFLELNIPADR